MGAKTHAIKGKKLSIQGENPQEIKTSSWEVINRTSGGKNVYRGGKIRKARLVAGRSQLSCGDQTSLAAQSEHAESDRGFQMQHAVPAHLDRWITAS